MEHDNLQNGEVKLKNHASDTGVKEVNSTVVQETLTVSENSREMSGKMYLDPPPFISDTRSYAEYKEDLNMWSRIVELENKVKAETVVYQLRGHPSRIKEKITTQLGDNFCYALLLILKGFKSEP